MSPRAASQEREQEEDAPLAIKDSNEFQVKQTETASSPIMSIDSSHSPNMSIGSSHSSIISIISIGSSHSPIKPGCCTTNSSKVKKGKMFNLLAIRYIVLIVAGLTYVTGFDARIAAVWNAMNKHPTDGYGDQVEVQIYFSAMKTDPANPNGVSVDEFTRGWRADTGDNTSTCYFFFNQWDRNQNFFLDSTDLGFLFGEIDTNDDNRWDYLSEFYKYMHNLYERAPKTIFQLLL
ncbi:hypothetical protein CHS0354_005629 [Potamilus streckersoni]|uniref:Uncharacterized protein n=1 Tax=Potamilus streckersoni TaxID=2493646 RepID=A0AAE0SAZ9_9BIVA|nr:hypothetical protein CHS0354_005629 [Potamilus streckersoni]